MTADQIKAGLNYRRTQCGTIAKVLLATEFGAVICICEGISADVGFTREVFQKDFEPFDGKVKWTLQKTLGPWKAEIV